MLWNLGSYLEIMEELPQMQSEAVQLVRQVVSEGHCVCVYELVNNPLEGNALRGMRH
jgi:hypothetical protein